ncbi:hypothetical protein ACLOAV_002944 [Pseudogymnoascus australis]
MARLLDLLRKGRSIARQEGVRANVEWSHGDQVLKLTGVQAFSTVQFQAMEPTIDLGSVKDSLTNNQVGWSFLMEPGNDLQGSFRHLHQRAWEQSPLSRKAEGYIQLAAKFQRQLLTTVHFTGGLPGRGTEVTTMKWCNTRHVMRNIFVYHGRLIVITEYTKARHKTNRSFYIVHFLPLSISWILF